MAKTGKTAPSEPRPVSKVADWYKEADVVVVGLGGAGVCAALEASAAGAEVLVLELASGGGGSTALAGGLIYFGGDGGTPVQQACGFEDSKEDMYNFLMACSGPDPDEEKVRRYCDNSLEHFDWMVSKGVPFKGSFYAPKAPQPLTDDGLMFTGNEEAYPFNKLTRPVPRGHCPQAEGDGGGKLLMEKLIAALEKTDTDIEYDARALTLIIDGDHAVVGVVARIDMEERNIRAKRGVILCAGGFIMNHDMVARHCPKMLKLSEPLGNPGDDGVGIRMGIGAGGAAIHMDEAFATLPFYPPEDLIKGIIVNNRGERFINEDVYHGRTGLAAMDQPDGKVYIICDNDIFGRPRADMNMDLTHVEETIEDLEKAMGLPENSLSHTVKFYNRYAEKGEDPLFHKAPKYLKPLNSPPFAVLDCSLDTKTFYPGFTLGGLHTKATGEVLTEDGTIVKGLYAAGRNSCGLPRYGPGYASGLSIGGATFFGRLAGKSAAARG